MGGLVSESPDFWRGRRVMVTGHTGFKGAWLCLWLQSWGAEVTGYSLRPPTSPNFFDAADVGRGMRSMLGDIRNYDEVHRAMRSAAPEIVIHLAAQSLVLASYRNPIETYSVNVLGTAHLLEAVRNTDSVKAVIVITSDKCYDNREWFWGYREDEAMGGRDPYSSSKGCAELVTAAYRNSFFGQSATSGHHARIATARAGNVIGGGDWADDRLIPDVCRAFQDGASAKIRNPTAVRPWQHVLDPLSGYLMLAQRLVDDSAYAQAWNFGPGAEDARPVGWVAGKAAECWGQGASWHAISPPSGSPYEARYLKLDCSKANTMLGWSPRWRIDSAIAHSIDWYKAHLAGRNMRGCSLSQLERFLAADSIDSAAARSLIDH